MESDLDRILEEQRALERRYRVLTKIHLALPPLLMLGAAAYLWSIERLATYAQAAATSFFALGKLIIVFGAAPDATFGLDVLELIVMVVFMDILYAYFLAYNLHHVYRLRRLGPAIRRLHDYCRYVLDTRPWMRRWAFSGVAAFVLFPLTGTGAPGGSILGRIVGLGPGTTLFAIAFGSIVGCTLMAVFAAPLEPLFADIQDRLWFKAIGIAVIGILLLLLWRLGRRLSREAQAHAESRASGG